MGSTPCRRERDWRCWCRLLNVNSQRRALLGPRLIVNMSSDSFLIYEETATAVFLSHSALSTDFCSTTNLSTSLETSTARAGDVSGFESHSPPNSHSDPTSTRLPPLQKSPEIHTKFADHPGSPAPPAHAPTARRVRAGAPMPGMSRSLPCISKQLPTLPRILSPPTPENGSQLRL